jgi:hypothetical protein
MGVRFELEDIKRLFILGLEEIRHTMACERLCVLMTRPIVRSTRKEINRDIQISDGEERRKSQHPRKPTSIHPETNRFKRSFLSQRDE